MNLQQLLLGIFLFTCALYAPFARAASADMVAEIATEYKLKASKGKWVPQEVKQAIMDKIAEDGGKTGMKQEESVRNGSFLRRAEMYFKLGRLEREMFLERALAELDGYRKGKSVDKREKFKEGWHEALNLFGNASANFRRVEPQTAYLLQRIKECEDFLQQLETDLTKVDVELASIIQTQVKTMAPPKKCGLSSFFCFFRQD